MLGLLLLTVGFAFGSGGCAAKEGWRVSEGQCNARQTPRVCLHADPDAPVALRVGDTRIVPGECAELANGARGGSVRVLLEDGRGGQTKRRRVSTSRRRAKAIDVTLRGDDPPKLQVSRVRCD